MPASTTTDRQTWRRVIPAARSTPISRTRSRTFIVSVLTMPSAATTTATSARTSNSPNTRSSASPMAPWIRPSGTGSRASERASSASAARSAADASLDETHREGVGAGDPESLGIGPADEQRFAGRTGQGPLGDADDAQAQRRAIGRRDDDPRSELEAVAGGDARRDDDRAAGDRVRRGPPPGRRRPGAAGRPRPRSAPTIATPSIRTPSTARSNVAIGLTERTPGSATEGLVEPLVEAAREDRGDDEVARDDVGDPGAGRRTGMLADPAERDDHREADRQRTDRQRGAATVTQDGGAGEPLLEAGQQPERGTRRAAPAPAGRTGRAAPTTSRTA